MKPHIWAQLKNLTADELIAALRKDDAEPDDSHGSVRVFKLKTGVKIAIHYHPEKPTGHIYFPICWIKSAGLKRISKD